MARLGKVETKSKYIRDNALQGGVVDESKPFSLHGLDSETGKKILNDSYSKFLKVRFLETLRAKYRTRVLLHPPQPPMIVLDNVRVHTRGNANSTISITLIADFDCPASRRAYPEFMEIFKRYKDQVRFEAINLSSDVTTLILLSECAAEQGKFWNAYDAFFMKDLHQFDRDSLMEALNLKRNECVESKKLSKAILASMARLRSDGIELTPTILIGRRIYYGPLESEAIGRFVDDLLIKKKSAL